jgi:hypothetical protein
MTSARCFGPMVVLLGLVASACATESDGLDPMGMDPVSASRPAHERESAITSRGARAGTGGEESGADLSLDARFDQERGGARLMLSYDPIERVFTGTVENTTDRTLRMVRVEVHLSNGMELGPTIPVDLRPGASQPVSLAVYNAVFDGWSAHAEVGRDEHPGESEGEDHGEERGEHAEH